MIPNVLVFATTVLATQLNAQLITATQEGNEYNITAISGIESVVDFYNYRSMEFNGSIPGGLRDDTLHTFLYLDETLGDLSLVNVYDNGSEGFWDGGSASMKVTLMNDTADILVYDDPESLWIDPDNYYSDLQIFNLFNVWSGKNTDGSVIGSLDGNWELDIELSNVRGLKDWLLVSGDNNSYQLDLKHCRNSSLNIQSSSVPEPSTYGICGVLLLATLVYFHRRHP